MSGPGSRFKDKHSLDSDEEDEGDDTNSSKYDILASDDVDGMYLLLNLNYDLICDRGMSLFSLIKLITSDFLYMYIEFTFRFSQIYSFRS